jgi:carboxylesterase type B
MGYEAPVLVWIYGGGYVSGDKKRTTDPSTLLSRSLADGKEGVIYVAPKYSRCIGKSQSRRFKFLYG